MVFDWTLSSQKIDEIVIVDEDASRAAESSFGPKVEALGYKLDLPIVTIWRDAKIVRVEIRDPLTSRSVGQAIRLERGNKIEDAIEYIGPA